MLKYDIWGTFCHIAFENRFNGSRGLLKIRIMISQKIHEYSILATLLFLEERRLLRYPKREVLILSYSCLS